MIIGVSGRMGAGKDACATIIKEYLAQQNILIEKKQFAGKLKQFISSIIGCSLEQLEDQDFKKSKLPSEWNKSVEKVLGFNYGAPIKGKVIEEMSVRDMLIAVGHGLRVQCHSDIWVNALFADYKKQGFLPKEIDGELSEIEHKYPNWIIPDMRYVNEADRIKNSGGINIRIERPGIQTLDHPSETMLDDYEFTIRIVNNGTLDDLRRSIITCLSQVI